MTGQRLRLNQHERSYLLRLIAQDTNMQQELLGKPILKLIDKLTSGSDLRLDDSETKEKS